LIVTDLVLVPPALVALHVYVVPDVSVVRDTVPQPDFLMLVDSGSVTVQIRPTSLVNQPLVPSVPVIADVMTGGVVSRADAWPEMPTPRPRLRIDRIASVLIYFP
jgi:hypothetical protein